MGLWTLGRTACGSAAGNTRSDTALRRAGPGLDSRAKTETVAPKPVVMLVMVTKSLRSRRAYQRSSERYSPRPRVVGAGAGQGGGRAT